MSLNSSTPPTVTMKALKALLISVISLILSFFSFSSHSKTILVLGDSISAGFGIPPEKGWVNLLRAQLNEEGYSYQVINASVSGNTTGDGLGRLPPLLEKYHPKIVIVELGGNDGLRGYPIKIMNNNLQRIIDASKQRGATVLLAGMEIPPNYGLRYANNFRQVFKNVADKNKVPLLPFILEGVALNPLYMQIDGIHPRANAQPRLLANVWEYLKPLL